MLSLAIPLDCCHCMEALGAHFELHDRMDQLVGGVSTLSDLFTHTPHSAGWVALTATGGLLGSQLIMGVISLYSPAFVPQRWHQFLIYIGYTVFAFIVNTFANRGLPYVNQAALVWSLLGFTVICITVSCCA